MRGPVIAKPGEPPPTAVERFAAAEKVRVSLRHDWRRNGYNDVVCRDYRTWRTLERAVAMAEERVERRLAAILAGDVAGYSRLMGIDEEGTLAALKRHRRELVDPKIKRRGR